jgi:type 1 glutamine amidotransferase
VDIINYGSTRKLLTIARGHPYERDALHNLTQGLDAFDVCHVEQPVAQRLLNVETATEYDALLCYDMPGVDFTTSEPPGLLEPDDEFKQNYLAMMEAGIGIVFMHHALAAWPAWDTYAEIVGGRFHYRPAQLRGEAWPDSGYRHAVTHNINVVGDHPVTAGLPATFAMTDELYLCPIFEEDVIPLLRSDNNYVEENFYSAARAVMGEMHSREGWSHTEGSNLVGWVKHRGNSPIVYLQGGDDANAMANEHFQKLVHNAVNWVASEEAKSWARQQHAQSRE